MTLDEQPKDIIRKRREAVGLTQSELATIAKISRGIVRNAEAGKRLEASSHDAIYDVLAIKPSYLGEQEGEESIPLDVVRPLVKALAQLFITIEGPGVGSRASSTYVKIAHNLSWGKDISADMFNKLLPPIEERMSAAELKRVAEFLMDFVPPEQHGDLEVVDRIWISRNSKRRPSEFVRQTTEGERRQLLHDFAERLEEKGDTEGLRKFDEMLLALNVVRRLKHDETMSDYGSDHLFEATSTLVEHVSAVVEEVVNKRARELERLPLRVQELITSGEVVDADIVHLPNEDDVAMVTMVVRKKDPTASLTPADRRVMINALHVWHMALVVAGSVYKHMRDEADPERGKWMPPDKVEERIRAALEVIDQTPGLGSVDHGNKGEKS